MHTAIQWPLDPGPSTEYVRSSRNFSGTLSIVNCYKRGQTRSVTTGVTASESHMMLDDREVATFAPNEHFVAKRPLNNFSLSAVVSVFIQTFIMIF